MQGGRILLQESQAYRSRVSYLVGEARAPATNRAKREHMIPTYRDLNKRLEGSNC